MTDALGAAARLQTGCRGMELSALVAAHPHHRTMRVPLQASVVRELRGGALLGRDRGLLRRGPDLAQLRLEAQLEQAVDPVEVDVHDRRDEQRQQLRYAQAADDRDAERLAQLGAG